MNADTPTKMKEKKISMYPPSSFREAPELSAVPTAYLPSMSAPIPTLPATIPDEEEEDDDVVEARMLLENKLEAEFSPQFLRLVKRVSRNILKIGMRFNEACKLARVNPTVMEEKIKASETLKEYFSVQELEFKARLMKVITDKAILGTGDDKLASWLLQSRYPDEFTTGKRGGSTAEDGDLIAAGLSFIQKHGDATPLVTETSGRAFVLAKGNMEITKRLQDLLK